MISLKPMELGEIIDRSASFWRAHWRKLYFLVLGFNLAEYALLKLFMIAQERFAPLSRGGAAAVQTMKENPVEFMRQAAVGGVGLAATLVIFFFMTLLMTTAATRWVMPTFLGQSADIAAAVRHGLRRAGTLFTLFLMAIGWSLLVLVLMLLPGLLCVGGAAVAGGGPLTVVLGIIGALAAALGFVVWVLWLFIRFFPSAQVVAMEDVSALGAFRRTAALTSGRIGPGFLGLVKVRLTVLITVVFSLLAMISFISSAPALALQAIYGNMFDPMHADPNAVPKALLVPAELFNIAVTCVIYPLYVAFQVIFYVDMRTRREGLDLELKMKADV